MTIDEMSRHGLQLILHWIEFIFSKLMEVAVISSLLGNARQSLIATACEYVANMALHDEMTFDNTYENDLDEDLDSYYLTGKYRVRILPSTEERFMLSRDAPHFFVNLLIAKNGDMNLNGIDKDIFTNYFCWYYFSYIDNVTGILYS